MEYCDFISCNRIYFKIRNIKAEKHFILTDFIKNIFIKTDFIRGTNWKNACKIRQKSIL